MKKLEIIIRPERLDDLKTILNSCNAHGLMITNIMGYGSQKGHKQAYNGVVLAVTCFRRLRLKRLSMMIPQKRLLFSY